MIAFSSQVTKPIRTAVTMGTMWRLVFVTAVLIQGASCADLCAFKQTTFIQLPENTTVGSLVGYFNISGNVDEVELSQQAPLSPFMLNVTSREITLTAPLDFEKTQSYKVNAICRQTNPTFESTLVQRILIKDINDNPPVFTASSYTANVSELSSVGSVVFDGITANDLDGKNLYMQYEVVNGPYSEYLRFDRASKGEVTLNKSLDYETMQSFVVEIRALDTPEDTNSPRRSAVVNLTINVQDEDDMDPAFSKDHYSAKMDSNAAGGTTVNTIPAIYAEDQDLTDKSAIVYSIWDYGDSFAIDPDTAQVTLQKQLDKGVYTAVLRAAQVDNPRRRAIATMTLVVTYTGAQTRPPSFLKSHYDVSVLETTPVNHTLVSVQAVDPDFGSTLRYWLKDDINGMFRITPTADIQLVKSLDYEKVRQYSLDVSVTDGTYTASVMVKITVEKRERQQP
ncbi:protocadherin Fat 1-like [Liolophura sinensis]|uniref:protocadherin Fat 1-like n=1 Tax=Liolophura sinensis TaxID=3198878 RepID=UPI0031580CC2